MRFHYKLLSLAYLTLSAIAAPALPTTADDIIAALHRCNDAVVALEASIKIVTSTSSSVTIVETNIQILSYCVLNTIPIVQGSSDLTLVTATNVVGEAHATGLLIKDLLVEIVTLKPLFLKFGIFTVIRLLKVFQSNVYGFEDALAGISPAAIIPEIRANQLAIDLVFTTTVNGLSST